MTEKGKRFFRSIDPGYLLVLGICLLAIWPFISRASLPVETDAELHVFRLHELGYLIRGGEFYPRWAPNFYHGYGYPIFNYYAPLAYYVGLLVELWPQFDAVTAVKFVFVLGLLGGGLGMYGFVRDNWGRGAGYVATAVYLYAPYVQYIDPHARGVLPESFSLGLFPLALWAVDRVRRGVAGGVGVVTAVLLVAAVILSHNLMALLFFAILFSWASWHLLIQLYLRKKSSAAGQQLCNLRFVFAVLLLGLGVAALFWIPVILERNDVQLNTLLGQGDNYDFRTHFLTLREMLSPSLRLDWGASEPAFRFNLGVAQWLLGGLGILFVLLRRVKHRAHATFFIVALAVLLFLMSATSTFVWESVPFLPFFQFPWRLLGAVAAMLAVLAGVGTSGLVAMLAERHKQAALWMPALFVAGVLLLALPLSQPAPWGDFGEVNTLRMTMIENTGRWLGTTSTSDYVPATSLARPQREESMIGRIAEGKPLDRINYAVLPEGTEIETEYIRPLLTRYTINAPEPFLFRLYQFAFPGWEVRLDGEVVATELGMPEGLLVVPVPAGRYTLEVEFGTTPARSLGMAVSLLSLLLAVVLGWVWRRSRLLVAGGGGEYGRFALMDKFVALTLLLITTLFIFVLNPSGILHQNSQGFVAQPAQEDVFADFGEQIALIGYSTSTQTAKPGETIELTFYLQAQDALAINYQSFAHILRPDGTLLAQSDKINPGEFPTKNWSLDKYVRDVHYLYIPLDTPAGAYPVTMGLWVQTEGWRLPLLDEVGVQIGDNVPLFNLIVE